MKFILLILILVSCSFAHASWTPVTGLMDEAFKNKLFGGASLYVGDATSALLEYSSGESDSTKIYDIASLTKVVATTTSVMVLEERGEISLSDKVSKYFPDFVGGKKNDVTLENLMRHNAGLPAGAQPLANESFEAYIKRITKNPLNYNPRSKTVYSDLSFILMGRVVELVSGMKLSEFAEKNVFLPLKMMNSSYTVSVEYELRCAPTSSLRMCQVHDPIAYRLRPESVGNAGLFTTLEDLSRFGRMLLNKGELEGVRILSEATVAKMTKPSGLRGLGWDATSPYATAPRGDVFPAGISFGHTGYTGTTMWIDPKSQTFYVFLSNRVFMGDERTMKPFTAFRKKLSTAIGKVIYRPISGAF